MDPSPVTSREAFDAAIVTGELETIQAFVAQPHVRQQILETDASILETSRTDPTAYLLDDGSLPWFRRPQNKSSADDDNVLVLAACHGHAHVLAWFFSRECVAFMGITMAFVLPLLLTVSSPHACVLETLLTSALLCDFFSATQRQSTLSDWACHCQSKVELQLVLAHGACMHAALSAIVQYGSWDRGQVLQGEGVFLIGADVLDPRTEDSNVQHAGSFLLRGLDPRAAERLLLHAARRIDEETVVALLANGYLDVDVRDEHGRTALMLAVSAFASVGIEHEWQYALVASLLNYCDVDATDNQGRTALHRAVRLNRELAILLLANGADANLRDHDGVAPHDHVLNGVDVHWIARWVSDKCILDQLLRHGADPFAVLSTNYTAASRSVGSLYDRLMETNSGRVFIQSHAHYFRKDDESGIHGGKKQ